MKLVSSACAKSTFIGHSPHYFQHSRTRASSVSCHLNINANVHIIGIEIFVGRIHSVTISVRSLFWRQRLPSAQQLITIKSTHGQQRLLGDIKGSSSPQDRHHPQQTSFHLSDIRTAVCISVLGHLNIKQIYSSALRRCCGKAVRFHPY